MSKPDEQRDPLEQLTEAFVNLPVPEGPDVEVKQRLLERLARASDEPVTIPFVPFWRRETMRKFAGVAAILLVLLGFAAYLRSPIAGGPGVVFAAMVEQMKSIRTASYVMEIEIEGLPKILTQVMQMEPGWVRSESKDDKLDFVNIINFQESKMLSLLHKEKQAQLVEFAGLPESQQQKNHMEDFRQMKHDDAKFLGRELVDGISALKYRYDGQMEHYTIWLNPADNLPVRMVMTDVEDEGTVSTRLTMKEIAWNPELDKALFTLEIPEGYELVQQTMEVADRPTDDFVTMLRFITRLNSDQFPDGLNLLTWIPLLQKTLTKPEGTKEEKRAYKQEKLAYALERPDIIGMTGGQQKQLGLELAKYFGGGAMYLESTKQTHHWHYQGKGIKLGEADKIVAWWYPKKEKAEEGADPDTAQVLYGDLRIETMPVAELPKTDAE